MQRPPPNPSGPKVKGAQRRPVITDHVATQAQRLLERPEIGSREYPELRRYLGQLVAYKANRNERKAALS